MRPRGTIMNTQRTRPTFLFATIARQYQHTHLHCRLRILRRFGFGFSDVTLQKAYHLGSVSNRAQENPEHQQRGGFDLPTWCKAPHNRQVDGKLIYLLEYQLSGRPTCQYNSTRRRILRLNNVHFMKVAQHKR